MGWASTDSEGHDGLSGSLIGPVAWASTQVTGLILSPSFPICGIFQDSFCSWQICILCARPGQTPSGTPWIPTSFERS